MLSNILEGRTSSPENILPIFNQGYSFYQGCLGHQSIVKITRLHDVKKKNKICYIDWTCDGEKLVYSTRDSIQIMNPQLFTADISIPGQWFKALPSKISNSELICISLNNPCIEYYDIRSVTSHFKINIPNDSFLNIAWSNDGKTIVTGDKTDNLYAIDIRFPNSSKLPIPLLSENIDNNIYSREPPYKIQSYRKFAEEINDIIFSEDNKNLIMARNDGKLEIIRLENSQDILNMNRSDTIHIHLYNSNIIAESSNIIASFGLDQTISLTDLYSTSVIASFNGIDGNVSTMKFNNNSEILSIGVSPEKKRSSEDSNDTLLIKNNQLKTLSRFDIPGRIASSSWHPYRQILCFACNSLDTNNANNTSSSNSGANNSSIHYNKIICSGLNGPNIPFIGFLTIE